jgi:hypothetical protein
MWAFVLSCFFFYKNELSITSNETHVVIVLVSTLGVLFSYGFCFDFSFHLVFTLIYLTRFCGSLYLKCFSAISFIVRFCRSVLRLFMFRFVRAFRSVSFEMELS